MRTIDPLLSAELQELESETFEVCDLADGATELLGVATSCATACSCVCSCSSSCSSTSTSSCS